MALYSYEAFNKEGARVKGIIDLPSVTQVKDFLAKQGLYAIKIELARQEQSSGILSSFFATPVKEKDKIVITKQLAVLLRSGVPLLQALELLVEQFEGAVRTLLVNIKDEVKEGSTFADALKKYPRTFDTVYLQLVKAGEASGQLDTILGHLAEYIENNAATRKRIKKALQEPTMQLLVSVAVVIFLLAIVVPQMTESFAQQGQELPSTTLALLAFSRLFTHHYFLTGGTTLATIIFYNIASRTPKGAHTIDSIKLRLPLIKYFTKTRAVVQFSYALGTLVEGGVNLAEALDIVCSIVDNKVLSNALSQAKDKIVKQGKITEYLKQTNIFPPIAIYLIRTGEETGKLGEMLLLVAKNYEIELNDLTEGLTATIQPIMTIVMAIVVGFIIMAIASPMLDMGKIAGV